MQKLYKFLFLTLLLTFVMTLQAQVQVIVPSTVYTLVAKHVSANGKQNGKMQGFCVQICFESGNNSREKAERTRMAFLSKHPNVPAYVSFKEPNFRVRVGNFRTRAEARGFREDILNEFPQSFVIRDDVMYPIDNNN